MNNIYLFQPQRIYTYKGAKQAWLPYSIGCLWSYALTNKTVIDNFTAKKLYFSREPIETVITDLDNPKICLFSTYVWNEQYNLHLAKIIKKQFPECIIIFGGPQTNKDALLESFIDVVVLGEGEESFLTLLLDYLNNDLNNVYYPKRIKDLDKLISPYTSGIFNNIISENPDLKWLVTFETDRGCPYKCTFCDWGSVINSKVFKLPMNRIEAELNWFAKNNVVFIFMANANFGILKQRDLEISKMMASILKNSLVETIIPQFAKNSNDTILEIAKNLKPFLGKGLSMSNQSMSEDVLLNIERVGMPSTKHSFIASLAESIGVPYYTELILGLPGETEESFIDGLYTLLELGQHERVDLHIASVLKNSKLASQLDIFGIKTRIVEDLTYYTDDYDDIKEKDRIIISTDSMNANQMVNAYMFHWVIYNFHLIGYSQVFARYLRSKDISYKDYYSKLISQIPNNHLIYNLYEKTKKLMTSFFDIDSNLTVDLIHRDDSVIDFYINQKVIIDFSYDIFCQFIDDEDKFIYSLQKNSIIKDISPSMVKFEIRKSQPLDKNFLKFI